MSQPFLSFIAAVYNKADVLLDTLNCLRSQQDLAEQDVEFVFVDDGSSDGSLDLLALEAKTDERIKLISDGDNLGPSIRFNQAAKAARGQYLLAIDADDLLPVNAASFMLETAKKHQAQVVFGRSKRSLDCPLLPSSVPITLSDTPFDFAAKKKIVRMGILCERATWLAAGGANEAVFIQDQSLPLRLSAASKRIAYIEDYVYFLRPADDSNLSANIMQQHHDRFFALCAFLDDEKLSRDARTAIMQQIVSSLWKIERDGGKSWAFFSLFSAAHYHYLLNKLTGRGLRDAQLQQAAHMLRALPNIRRPAKG
ncbi:MAG: glycosyltransferase [Cohaesibacter sp.]|nr:glycosyltransferase [Cohaesibacter sp.]